MRILGLNLSFMLHFQKFALFERKSMQIYKSARDLVRFNSIVEISPGAPNNAILVVSLIHVSLLPIEANT